MATVRPNVNLHYNLTILRSPEYFLQVQQIINIASDN